MPRTLLLPEQLAPDSTVLIAVSGGGDSVFLAHELAGEKSLRLHLAHVNHGRRGDEDAADVAFVRDLAERLGAGFTALRLPASVEGTHSLEERLREGRLTALRAEAKRIGAAAIAFGHTADDVAETFLLMALRGSGPTGLGSLRAARWSEADGLWMLRPLLEWTREEIRAALRERGLTWREDPTNDLPMHRRNRLRAGVMPLLAEEEPAAAMLLARSAQLCGEASDLLEAVAEEDLERALAARREGALLLRNAVLRELSPARLAIALRVAGRRVADGRFPLPPPLALVQSLGARVLAGGGEPSVFRDDEAVRARVDGEHTLLYSSLLDERQALEFMTQATTPILLLPDIHAVVPVANSSQRATPMRSRVMLPDTQGSLAIEVTPREALPGDWSPVVKDDQREACFDPLSIRRDLVLRAAHEGETISLGAAGSKSIAGALQEAGVPAELRERVAVLADDRGVLWIPGVRRAVSAYVTERSSLVLRLKWEHSPSPESSDS